jgi:hypothetical protein
MKSRHIAFVVVACVMAIIIFIAIPHEGSLEKHGAKILAVLCIVLGYYLGAYFRSSPVIEKAEEGDSMHREIS